MEQIPHDNHLKTVFRLFKHELFLFIFGSIVWKVGRDSSVDTATRYGLERSGDRIPVGKAAEAWRWPPTPI